MSLMKVLHANDGLEYFLGDEPVLNIVLRLSLALEILHRHGGILVALIELARTSLEECNPSGIDMATTDETTHVGTIEETTTWEPIPKTIQYTSNLVDSSTC